MSYNLKQSLVCEFLDHLLPAGEMSVESSRKSSPLRSQGCVGGRSNGIESSDIGRNVNGCSSNISPGPVRAEPRFETFLMTGDMMIKTTKVANVPSLSRLDRLRHDESNVSGSVDESKELDVPLPSPPELCDDVPRDDPLSRCPLVVPRSLPDVVQNDFFAGDVSDTQSASFQGMSECDLPALDGDIAQPTTSLKLQILGCPRFPDIPVELDIPPDDISSEDEQYRDEPELDVDDLPPPPDEFLTDFVPRLESDNTQDIDFEFESPPGYDRFSSNNARQHGTDALCLGTIVSSKSEERISPRTVSEKSKLSQDMVVTVRGSRSQDNYLHRDSDGVVVDIDFGEHVATSVDTLHYQQFCASLETVGLSQDHVVKSFYSMPQKPISADRVIVQTSLNAEESKVLDKNGDFAEEQGVMPLEKGLPPEIPVPGILSEENSGISDGRIVGTYFGAEIAPPESFQTSDSQGAKDSGSAKTSLDQGNDDSDGNADGRSGDNPNQHMVEPDSGQSPDGGAVASGEPSAIANGGGHRSRPSEIEDPLYDLDDSFRLPSKDVDKPSAQRLAQRLYHLKGFQKKDVAKHLSKKNDFAQLVGEEYLKHFDFTSQLLDVALRSFLQRLVLSGETQERERILAHFSHRYIECNPESFSSEDSCHTLTCAMMLLNTDLHLQNVGRKMTVEEFIENLADLNDGVNYPKDLLRSIYRSIQNEAIEVEGDDAEEPETGPKGQSFTLGSNPFLNVSDPSKATEFKNGYVMRKCCMDPDGRKTGLGRRSWKMFYATLRDMVLYLFKDAQGLTQHFPNTNNAIRVHHSLATLADDYQKKQYVFRLQTADGAEYLFQTSNSNECQLWIDEINYATAVLSAPPLPGAVGSQRKFQRPLMPSSSSKLNLVDQLRQHQKMLDQIEMDLGDHERSPPEKGAKSRTIQDYLEKELYLQFEQKRFKTYCTVLESKLIKQSEALDPLPMEMTIEESSSASIVSSQKEAQKSASVQRSKSDRLSRPFSRYHSGSNSKAYLSMHSAKSMPSIFLPKRFQKGKEPTASTTWYAEFDSLGEDTELTYC